MQFEFSDLFIVISFIIAAVDGFLARQALRREDKKGMYLGIACIWAIVVDISYLLSILTRDYFFTSLTSSIYFSSIDIMTVCLLVSVRHYTGYFMRKSSRVLFFGLLIWMAADLLVMLINPFYEIAVRYERRDTLIAHFRYQMMAGFELHLLFTYIIVVIVLAILCHKAYVVPSDYRRQYLYAVYGILLVVGCNAFFLFLPQKSLFNMLDYSIWGYSAIAAFLYWDYYMYASHGMLNHFKNMIFDIVDQGILLFDYENKLILKNSRVTSLLSEAELKQEMELSDFLEQCHIPLDIGQKNERCSLQCYTKKANKIESVRCDYRTLKNNRGELMGRLFVLSDAAQDTDVLTGFQSWESFQRFAGDNPLFFGYPAVVAICDINNLVAINKSFGRSRGDQLIQYLSELMRKSFPKTSYFVRGEDANMIAICYGREEEEILECLEKIQEEENMDIQYAVSMATKEKPDVLDAIARAKSGMTAKKLQDKKSVHSHLLTSLVRALQECDSDTEVHVKRTQEMGAALGKRIGLSDVQLSRLSLLCLLHDIGKIGIPLEILNKPGKLSEQEWRILRSHVEKGFQIASSSWELEEIADMILHHHERWDGKGYPDGLSGENIPLLSRVIAVVDAYDAMTNDRSYRKALSVEEAGNELKRCSGTQFDPYIVDEFLAMLREREELVEKTTGDIQEQVNKVDAEAADDARNIDVDVRKGRESTVHPVCYSRYILDSHQNIISIDDNFELLTGYQREDIENGRMSQADLIFPEERMEYFCQVNEQLGRNAMAFIEHRIKCKDGSMKFVFCYGKQFYDSAEREMRSEIIITSKI